MDNHIGKCLTYSLMHRCVILSFNALEHEGGFDVEGDFGNNDGEIIIEVVFPSAIVCETVAIPAC